MLSFSGKNIQNDPLKTEGRVAFQKNPDFVKFHKFQAEFQNSGCVTGWLYVSS